LRELKGLVNIVPVISKSDSLTMEERRKYLIEIRDLFKSLEMEGQISVFDFDEKEKEWIPETTDIIQHEEKEEIASPRSQTSAVNLSSDDEVMVDSRLSYSPSFSPPAVPKKKGTPSPSIIPNVFGVSCDQSGFRVYPWGTVETENPNHSDFPRLRSLIFEKGYINQFRSSTQKMTTRLCSQRKNRKEPRDFFRFVVEIAMAVGAGLIIAFMLSDSWYRTEKSRRHN
jgi:hypothetical protein